VTDIPIEAFGAGVRSDLAWGRFGSHPRDFWVTLSEDREPSSHEALAGLGRDPLSVEGGWIDHQQVLLSGFEIPR
jgi:hypothetical protein